jgi:Zn-dependent peptidase ImmA (M78 family)/transcriptional regulator with XRE-family HTH domain
LLLVGRQLRGLSQAELAARVGLTQGHLSRIEQGLSEPTVETVERLARALELPKSFLEQPDRVYGLPVSVHPMFRKKANIGQRELDRIRAELNIRIVHLQRLLQAVEFEGDMPLPRLDLDRYGGDIEQVAGLVRRSWLLPPGPIENLTEAVERAGVLVSLCDFRGAPVDGLTLAVPGLPPCIFLNRHSPADRLRFSLAHEVGHLVLHHGGPTPEMEDEASAFAAALLMPARDVFHQYGERVTLPRLAQMKRYWRVAMAALLMRAKRLGVVNYNQERYLWQQLSSNGWRLREPVELDFPSEEPEALPGLLRLHLEDLEYTASELAAMLHVHERDLRAMYPLPERGKKVGHLRIVT